MSALCVEERLTAAEWAARMRDAMTDQGYRTLPGLGQLAALYVDQIRFEDYSDESIANREPVLRLLAIDFMGREPSSISTEELRQFLARHWADSARGTKANRTNHVRTFFRWLADEGHIHIDVAQRIRSPKKPDTTRQAKDLALIRQLVQSQPNPADKLALEVLYWLGLRRNELRLIQFGHFNYADLTVIVHGKGRRIVPQEIPGELAARVEVFQRDRDLAATDYLLHAQRVRRDGSVMWLRPEQPMSPSGVYRWFARCLERAGLDSFPMHEIRHTAGTHFYQASEGDLIATQHFMRHQDPGVTAKTYIHIDRGAQVAKVQRRMEPLS